MGKRKLWQGNDTVVHICIFVLFKIQTQSLSNFVCFQTISLWEKPCCVTNQDIAQKWNFQHPVKMWNQWRKTNGVFLESPLLTLNGEVRDHSDVLGFLHISLYIKNLHLEHADLRWHELLFKLKITFIQRVWSVYARTEIVCGFDIGLVLLKNQMQISLQTILSSLN